MYTAVGRRWAEVDVFLVRSDAEVGHVHVTQSGVSV